jgi:hypothetical protein
MYFLIASLGLMFILKYGSILKFLRDFLNSKSDKFKELFSCSLCLGFWTGVLLVPLIYSEFTIPELLAFPLVSAAFCNIVDMLLDKMLE